MNLMVDVGNSTIVLALFKGEDLVNKFKIKTDIHMSESEVEMEIRSLFSSSSIALSEVEAVVYSSVVPVLNHSIKEALASLFNAKIITIGAGTKTGLPLVIDSPSEVGNDLIADLVGAKFIYGYPALIIDMGTATKFLFLDKNGAFSSAHIIPGLVKSANSLKDSTFLLPEVGLEKPKGFLAKNTIDAINNGIIYSNVKMIEGMAEQYQKAVGYDFKLILTGGCANLIADMLDLDYTYDENLLVKGLNIILEKNQNEK
ncbi:MAG: type III pantothenate kinase [Coprobacillus sp.]|nr:type III pantothenate kinase [Coprobacillus sp.]